MSDLQLSLLALGAVIIAGVILFNWWQERRFMQESVNRFDAPNDDALMEEFRIDTGRVAGLDNEAVVVEERVDDYDIAEDATLEELHQEVVEEPFQPREPESESVTLPEPEPEDMYPEFADADEEPAAEPPLAEEQAAPVAESAPHAAPRAMPADLDEQVDLIAVMLLDTPLDIAAFDAAVQELPKFDKPVRWSLREETGVWHPWTPELPSGGCTRIACALQLADRSGAVSQGTLLAFQEQLADLASGLGATFEWHGSDHPLPYAAELDQFCVEVDVMVGFHIMQGGSGAFAGTKLRGLAEAGGMKLHEDGAFHYCNAEGATLFSLVSQDQRPFKPETLRTVFYRGVSFQLDVPRVGNCVETFNQMVLFARQMESSLDGMLVDDNQRALGDAEIEKIRQQLKMIHARMVTRGILPGTPIALRLFS